MRLERRNVVDLIGKITVEPVLLVCMLGISMFSPVLMQLIEQHICRNLYSAAVCANLSAHRSEAEVVQGEWAIWGWYLESMRLLPGILFSLFVAPWSDKFGRRWMMLAPSIVGFVETFHLLANVWWPTLPTWNILIGFFIYGLTGGLVGIQTACMAYVADVSDGGDALTVRIGMLGTSIMIGSAIGSMLGAVLVAWGGATACFAAYGVCSLFNVLYVTFVVKEVGSRAEAQRTSGWEKMRALADVDSIKRIWRTLNKRREGERHRLLWLWLFAVTTTMLFNCAYVGQAYLEFPPFNWSLAFFMLYGALTTYYYIFFMLTVFPWIKLYLRWSDGTLTVLGSVVSVAFHALFYYARSSILIYVAALISAFNMSMTALRALVSRSVDEDEQGCIFAVLTITEKTAPLVAGYFFAELFAETQHSAGNRSLIFGVGALLLCVPLALFALADVLDRSWRGGKARVS